jgi:hypothetical protein
VFEPPPMPERPRRLPWPQLLARVFGNDILSCPCGGRRRLVAFIPRSREASEILERLGIDCTAPPIAKARTPPHQESWFADPPPDDRGVDEQGPDSP